MTSPTPTYTAAQVDQQVVTWLVDLLGGIMLLGLVGIVLLVTLWGISRMDETVDR